MGIVPQIVPNENTEGRPEAGSNETSSVSIQNLAKDPPSDWTVQQHLAAIVESSDDAIVSKSLNGIILTWNRGAERIFGYSAEEAVGRHISMLGTSENAEEFSIILERISRGECIDRFQTKRKTKDGRIISISLSVSPVRDSSGAIIGAAKIARDVTLEQHYSELKAHLAAIVESSDDAIISKDLNGIIRSWNRGAQRLFGYEPHEVLGKHVSILTPPDREDEIPRILERISRGELVEPYQTKRKAKDGRILTISLTVSPIRDASGLIIGASKIARDITQQERYQQAIRRANDMLRRSNEDLEQFAYSAYHDLQEPLRMVATYGEMLQRRFADRLGDLGDQYVRYMVEGATRMDQLLKDLRVYTQASKEGEQPGADADTNEAFRRAVTSLKVPIESSAARIRSGALPPVRMHEFQLEQLFQNLIANAIRYRSDKPPEICVDGEHCDGFWKFSIRDNGIGIDSKYKEQIFGMFKRLHSAADYPGTGMGLAICQRIVERAGGRIWVESEPGRGSTFFFTIPVSRDH